MLIVKNYFTIQRDICRIFCIWRKHGQFLRFLLFNSWFILFIYNNHTVWFLINIYNVFVSIVIILSRLLCRYFDPWQDMYILVFIIVVSVLLCSRIYPMTKVFYRFLSSLYQCSCVMVYIVQQRLHCYHKKYGWTMNNIFLDSWGLNQPPVSPISIL